jgi:hypothetical protein
VSESRHIPDRRASRVSVSRSQDPAEPTGRRKHRSPRPTRQPQCPPAAQILSVGFRSDSPQTPSPNANPQFAAGPPPGGQSPPGRSRVAEALRGEIKYLAAGDTFLTNASAVGSAGLKAFRCEPTAFGRVRRVGAVSPPGAWDAIGWRALDLVFQAGLAIITQGFAVVRARCWPRASACYRGCHRGAGDAGRGGGGGDFVDAQSVAGRQEYRGPGSHGGREGRSRSPQPPRHCSAPGAHADHVPAARANPHPFDFTPAEDPSR